VRIRERLPAPQAALPLALLYIALSALHVWQASRHTTPTIFTDEIEFTQVSRSIAETGRPAFRDGAASGFQGLYPYLAAPAWWLDSVGQAYGAIKTLGALLMSATIFPAYGIARLVVSRPAALLVAAAVAAAPALAYAPMLVEEPLAYPVGTLALFLIMRWAAAPSWGRLAAAVGSCTLGAAARGQLTILFAVLGLAMLAWAWRGDRMRAWRRTWTVRDWIGGMTLAVGAALVVGALLSHRSYVWYVATTSFKGRMLDFGTWALGALAIGLGVIPLVAGLASLVPSRGLRLGDRERAFVVVTAAALLCFVIYTAVKGAYLSTVFADLILERNLIYLTPLLFTGTAWLLVRGGGRAWALVAAGVVAVVLVVRTPYSLANYPNYEAHGLAVLAFANREWVWTEERIENVLLWIAVVGTLVLLAFGLLRSRPLRLAVAGVLAAVVLTWTLTAEIYAARGENGFAERMASGLPRPYDWLDRTTGGERTVFLGQGITDDNPLWALEFWNRSLRRDWSLDATAPGPGGRSTADLLKADGTLWPEPNTDWVVAGDGVRLGGARPQRVGVYTLERLHGPIKLGSAVSGVSSDGWMGERAAYNRYDVKSGTLGLASIIVSRTGWCGKDKPGRVTVEIGPLAVTPTRQPKIARVTQVAHDTLNSCEKIPILLRAPPGPWRAEVRVTPTFSPKELDPAQGDTRQLGAQVSFDYRPLSG
jgi:hypothetical protein